MIKSFEFAGDSIVGTSHLGHTVLIGGRNQDAIHTHHFEHGTIIIVCDGCSNEGELSCNEFGAIWGSRVIPKQIELSLNRVIKMNNPRPDSKLASFEFLETARQNTLAYMRVQALTLGESLSNIAKTFFLFTVVGALLTTWGTVIFSIGDGIYWLNGEKHQIGPFISDEGKQTPPYLAFGLFDQYKKPELLKFQIHRVIPTEEVQNLLIGTDGMSDFADAEEKLTPQGERLGPVSQFWTDDIYFKDDSAVGAKLALANTTYYEITQRGTVRKKFGVLKDDTSLIVGRREKE